MTNLGEHNGRKIVPAEAADLGPPSPAKESEEAENKEDGAAAPASSKKLDEAAATALGAWLLATLPERLASVESTDRLTDSPAVVFDAE